MQAFTNPESRDDFVRWFNETRPDACADLWAEWSEEIESEAEKTLRVEEITDIDGTFWHVYDGDEELDRYSTEEEARSTLPEWLRAREEERDQTSRDEDMRETLMQELEERRGHP